MKTSAAQHREWLVATSALQRLQLTVAARRLSAHAECADAALRPWISMGAVTLPLLAALRVRRGRWPSALTLGLACGRVIRAFSRRH